MKPASLSEIPALAEYAGQTLIVYDGECPFCSRFVAWQRLRQSVGPVSLQDARENGALARALWAAGYDLDNGMVLIWNDQIFYGDECVHRLALLSSGSGLFNKMNAWAFRSPGVARLVYPLMRTGRNLTLRLLGRRKLTQNAG